MHDAPVALEPSEEAERAIKHVISLHESWAKAAGHTPPDLRAAVHVLVDVGATGADMRQDIADDTFILNLSLAACAYALDAHRACDRGERDRAWSCVACAHRLIGQAEAFISMKKHPEAMASMVSRVMANLRHGPTKAAMKWVQDEWRLHRAEYKGKAEFGRIYAGRLRNERSVKVTDRQIWAEWLKGL